jgi:hypothetical protein
MNGYEPVGQIYDVMDLIHQGMAWLRLQVGDFLTVRSFGTDTDSPNASADGFQQHKLIVMNKDDVHEPIDQIGVT